LSASEMLRVKADSASTLTIPLVLLTFEFSNCMDEAMQNVTIAPHIDKEDHNIVVNGLSAAYMAQIVEYNAQPDLEYGSATD
jgi:hypothetical protein